MQRPGDRPRARSAPIDRGGHEHFPLIEPLRAIAALCVVTAHCAFLSSAISTSGEPWRLILDHMNVGVAIFFLISGFVLYRPFVAARERGVALPSLGRYAWRRFLRIAPAYWLALVVLAAVPGVAGVFTHNWWVYFSLLQIYPIFTVTPDCVTAPQCGLAQTWSLAVEVSFYILLPFIAFGVDAVARRCRYGSGYLIELFVVGWLGALSIVVRAFTFGNPDLDWTFATMGTYFDWFAVGILLASASVALSRSSAREEVRAVASHGAPFFWAGAVGVYLLLCWSALPPTAALTSQTLAQDMQEHLGFALVGLLLLAPAALTTEVRGLSRVVLGNPVMMFLGKISYGIFLWHLTIALALAHTNAATWWPDHEFWGLTLSVLALTIPIAAVSYYLMERPILDRLAGSRRPRVPAETSPAPDRAGQPRLTDLQLSPER